jgi:hypothetical protein
LGFTELYYYLIFDSRTDLVYLKEDLKLSKQKFDSKKESTKK